jgi:dTDP-4-amino-4,6-dideoxygalactose transaminase
MENKIPMVDLHGQYLKIKPEIDAALQQVIDSTAFIGGPAVTSFSDNLSAYLGGSHAITCANGTDALQIALMALGLRPGDEVIVPAFTYVASAEVIGLLGLTPVLVDVDPATFNLTAEAAAQAITPRTRAIIPVHLFGQSCDMEPLLQLAKTHNLYVIEDNAQAIGATYRFSDGHTAKTGTMGTIGCTSFFPSKNLGCYGDGGALFTNDPELATRIRMIANHGQRIKYHHDIIGCNSRLDSIQAAILDVKLRHLDEYNESRNDAAHYYTSCLKELAQVVCPAELPASTHVYHQYTLKVENGLRDALKAYLASCGIPSMVYYPLPLQEQAAFRDIARIGGTLDHSTRCAENVLSLPIHTELTHSTQDIIIEAIFNFFKTH